jgi:hypothetical protein
MAASSPAKKPKDKYALSTWGREPLTDLEMPSGQLAQVRIPGVTGLIKAGLFDSLDTLTSLVQTEHIDRVTKGESTTITPEQIKMLSQDAGKMVAAIDLMDRVVEYVVVQPKVLRPVERDEEGKPLLLWKGKLDDAGEQVMEEIPLPDDKREPGVGYTDLIDPTDKVYLFQYVVGGVRDLETFRKEFQETLGGLESI